MGLISNNKKPIKKEMKKPLKKPMMKKIEKPIVNETAKQKPEETIEETKQVIENETVEETPEVEAETEEVEESVTEEQETDVNADEKNDVCVVEDFESEEKSETEVEDENVSEQPEVKEEPKEKKTKKKQSKKDKQKNIEKDNLGNSITDYNEAHDYLSETINFTSEEWEIEKEELANQVKTLYISPDLNPDSIKKLLSDMSIAYTTVKERLCDVENYYNGLEKKIKDIKVLNSVGANASERNINAQRAVNFYKNNPNDDVYIDLELYAITIQDKMNFYKSLIDTMNYNRQLLITFASAFKIEINNY